MKNIIISICIIISLFFSINTGVHADNEIYDNDNKLMYYSSEYQGYEKFTLPEISKQDAIKSAIEFIQLKAPEIITEIDMENHTVMYSKSYPYGYNINFPRIINGIEYNNENISIFVDSKNGKVIDFTKNFTSHLNIEDTDELIGKKVAQEKYTAAFGLQMQYNKKIINNKIQTYITYTAEDIIINAQTGNIISTDYYIPTDGYFDVVNTAEKVSKYVDDGTAISINKADNIIRGITELEVNDNYDIKSVNYLKNYDDTYLISLIYKNKNDSKQITLNAVTGLLVEYCDNSADIYTDIHTDTEAFAEKYYGEYKNHLIKRKNVDSEYSVLLCERLVNGIPYKSNGLYICCKNGKIKSISFLWDNVEFPSTDNLISYEYAYNQFFVKTGLDLMYYMRNNGTLTPVYRKSSRGTGIIDAKSGKQLNYDGSNYYSEKEKNYLDIDIHYAGYAARELSNCDIHVSSGNVFLGDYITQQEYLLLISEFINGTKPILNTSGVLTEDQREMLYAYMYSNKIIDINETDYTAYVTRANAVKYLLRILGHRTIGEMSDIFIHHFDDYNDIPKNLIGYIELARSLKIINGSGNNLFHPNNYITNGDSLIIMHNYLKQQG